MECILKMCDAIDESFDDRISAAEIKKYVKKKQLPIKDFEIDGMFEEATSGRLNATKARKNAPLLHEEIHACVKGRHAWNAQTKTWEVKYRTYRNFWIVLLMTVNDKLFV